MNPMTRKFIIVYALALIAVGIICEPAAVAMVIITYLCSLLFAIGAASLIFVIMDTLFRRPSQASA